MQKNKFIILFATIFLLIFVISISVFYETNFNKNIYTSKDSGFYDKEFYLTIKASKKYKIRYTLDSSTPTINSKEYTEPILIKDISNNENVFFNMIDVDPIFKEEEYRKEFQNASLWRYNYAFKKTNIPVPKATILKIGLFDDKKIIKEETKIFFIGFNNKKEFKNIYYASIIIDKDKLLSLYNATNKFTEIRPKIIFRTLQKVQKTTMEFILFNQEKKLNNQTTATTKIIGNLSRAYPQKSFEVFSQNLNSLNNKLFNNPKNNSLVIFAGSQDILKIKDFLIYNLENKIKPKQEQVKLYPCALFVNGEFWGAYYLMEDKNRDFVSQHYKIPKNSLYFIKNYKSRFQIEKSELEKDLTLIFDNNLSDNKMYSKAKEKFNIENFAELFATHIYIANMDIGSNEIFFKNNKEDTKWQLLANDFNTYSIANNPNNEMFDFLYNISPIFKSLSANPKFRELVINHIAKLEKEVYTQENAEKYLQKWEEDMMPLVQLTNKIYYDHKYAVDKNSINFIRDFFKERPKYLKKEIEEFYAKL